MRVSSWSVIGLAALFLLGFSELAVSLHRVQVEDVADFKKDLTDQATRRMRKPGIRGRILDAKGGVLAESRARRDIVCDLSAFLKSGSVSNTVAAVEAEIARLADELGFDRPSSVTADRIRRHIRTQSAVAMCVWRDLDEQSFAKFEERASAFRGFSVETYAERIYPRGTFAAHVVGYTGRDRSDGDEDDVRMLAYELEMKGRSGLEAFYDEYLAGVAGAVRIPVDARGFKPSGAARSSIALGETEERAAQDGLDLQLTLDPDIQAAVERQLDGVCGACVVLDPRDGAVLAMASAPTYNPNDFVPFVSAKRYRELSDDEERPLLNRATSGLYPPGSTFKPVTALAALKSGMVKADAKYECTGVYRLGDMRLHCWNRWGQGMLDMRQAIEQSCNPYFARLGYLLGTNTLFRMAREFGFEVKTGIDYRPERAGALASPPFYPGLASQSAIGQGRILVTPLQMAVECAALANGGKVFAPYLKKRTDGTPPEPVRRLSSTAADMEVVRLGMRSVVEGDKGTGKTIGGLRVPCAGKTGTAQIGGGMKHTWVIAFAPYDSPTVAVAMVVERGASGGKTVAPRVHAVLASIFGEAER